MRAAAGRQNVCAGRSRVYSARMNPAKLLMLALTAILSALACAGPLPVVVRNGESHVAATALEREAGIVIKKLPGKGQFVACAAEQCAPVKSVVVEGETLLVPVTALSEAMNLTATFDDARRHVTLSPGAGGAAAATGAARVGAIAPNLRLTKLDGTPVSLDEFRGQRVLINSWASW